MADKTIKDRGLSTITLPAPSKFSFDKTTRQQELIYYFQYCTAHGLISVPGEQSRTTLILKTFNDLGGVGASWDAAMRNWLQARTPVGDIGLESGLGGLLTEGGDTLTQEGNIETDLYRLWLSYFQIYSSTPDEKGITYPGVSVEVGYRRFLSHFIGGSSDTSANFSDPFLMTDLAKFVQGKNFADAFSITDLVSFVIGHHNTFNDTTNLTDAMVIRIGKFFADNFTMSDLAAFKQKKGFADTVTMSDVFSAVLNGLKTFLDTVTITDALAIKLKLGISDSFTITDLITIILKKAFADTVAITDSLLVIRHPFYDDLLLITDDAVFIIGFDMAWGDLTEILWDDGANIGWK